MTIKLNHIHEFTGTIELLTGLHIGSGNNEMHIGGTDSPVIKHPHTNQPYIPGSSLKGKMRSLLEWESGKVSSENPLGFADALSDGKNGVAGLILQLFGGAPSSDSKFETLMQEIGPGRLAFWDCPLEESWVQKINEQNYLLTEVKMENAIDRIKSVAIWPRTMERVPAGARFDFRLTFREHEGDDQQKLKARLLRGFQLLEMTGIGGSVSRGYGKIKFTALSLGEDDWVPQIRPRQKAATA